MSHPESDAYAIFFEPGPPRNRADSLLASVAGYIFSALVYVISWLACLIEDFAERRKSRRKSLSAPLRVRLPAPQAPVTPECPPAFTPAPTPEPLPYWTGSGVWPLPQSLGTDGFSIPIHESTRPQHQAHAQPPHP